MRRTHALATAITTLALIGLTGCAGLPGNDESASGSSGGAEVKDVVLVTHDSFVLPKKVIADFDATSGYHLVVRSSGDAGALTTNLVLSAGNPDGDVSFGVDNTFASRALDHGVFAAYTPATVPPGVAQYDLPGDNGSHLTPIDNGNVCVNVDTTWFAAHHVRPPASLDDLTQPAYKNLMSIPGATTSSPGLAFLLATIAKYGTSPSSGWQAYWTKLMANGAKITDGWDQSYDVDFTQGGGHGDRPIVVSYDSSPAYTVKNGVSSTKALLDTCFRQVEYAGVLAGAKNPAGARAFVDFMLSHEVQEALPTSMYVFPVVRGTTLPATWAKFAVRPTTTLQVSPSDIDHNRDTWLQQWTDVISK